MAIDDVGEILEFLEEKGFDGAASVLREEVSARDYESGEGFDLAGDSVDIVRGRVEAGLWGLRPLNIGNHDDGDGWRLGSEFSSSTGAFVSMASSPSGFPNPYGSWPANSTKSQESSDRPSQFSTAREGHGHNMFGDSFLEIPLWMEDPAVEFYEGDGFITVKDIHYEENLETNSSEEVKESDFSLQRIQTSMPFSSLSVEEAEHMYNPLGGHENILEEDQGTRKGLELSDSHEDWEVFDLRIIHRKNRTGFEENKEFAVVVNSVIAGRYCVIEHLGSATFSKVIQARDLVSGVDVCLKIIKNDKDFFDQSLDEIKLLKFVNKHDPGDEHHILRLYDYFYYQEHLFIVCELLKANLYEFQKLNVDSGGEIYFTLARIQKVACQCLEGLNFLHHLGIIHCDIKPENILIKSYRRCKIKIIDLGSSCFRADNLSFYVQSRSYRAPEIIMGLPYDEKIDIWSLGCVLAELFTGEVLFPNLEIVQILARMIEIFGEMDSAMIEQGQEAHKYFVEDQTLYFVNEETGQQETINPGNSSLSSQVGCSDSLFIDFLGYLLQMNPQKRPTAEQALLHPWLARRY